MASTEQALMAMLRQLPTPITIIWQNGRYHWQCADGKGSSFDLVEAIEQSLRYVMAVHPANASHVS
ncbi:MAG TPA: hypothetical protein VKR42_00460 [Ktedonobacteraceae bacterium]|nr:hypothetical protein [Ktedonobacteraceae bacterium]